MPNSGACISRFPRMLPPPAGHHAGGWGKSSSSHSAQNWFVARIVEVSRVGACDRPGRSKPLRPILPLAHRISIERLNRHHSRRLGRWPARRPGSRVTKNRQANDCAPCSPALRYSYSFAVAGGLGRQWRQPGKKKRRCCVFGKRDLANNAFLAQGTTVAFSAVPV